MKKLFIPLLIFLCCAMQAGAQGGSIQWQKTYGGSGDDLLSAILHTADGGYLMAGTIRSSDGEVTGYKGGEYDAWLVKTDSSGNIQWQKTYGGSGDDWFNSIQPTADGGCIAGGATSSTDGDITEYHGGASDCWAVKISASGAIEWSRVYGGSAADAAANILQTYDGGYIIAATTLSSDGDVTVHHDAVNAQDYWVVKLNDTGGIQWQRALGGTSDDEATSIVQTADSGYVIAGSSKSVNGDVTGNHGGADIWVVKLSRDSNIVWQRSIGGPYDENASDIKQTADGGYIICGESGQTGGQVTNNNGYADIWMVKLDTGANIQWEHSFGGNGEDVPGQLTIAANGSYLVAGSTASTNGDVSGLHSPAFPTEPATSDCWLLNVSATGLLLAQKCLGGSGDDYGQHVLQLADGALIIAATTTSTDGDVTGNHGNEDYWLLKLKGFPDSTTAVANINILTKHMLYPNPTTNTCYITNPATIQQADVYALSGNLAKTVSANIAAGIDMRDFADGYYIVKLTCADGGVVYEQLIVNN